MRLYLIVFCLFSVAHANFFDDLLQSYDEQGETLCVPINNDRIAQAAVRTAFQDLLTGFIDGFFDCEMRTSNTGNTGLGNFVIYSAYGIGGGIGVFYRKLFNLR